MLGLSLFAPKEVVDGQGTAFANVLWAAQIAFQVTLGLPFLWSRHVRIRSVLRMPEEVAEKVRMEEAENRAGFEAPTEDPHRDPRQSSR